MLLPLLDMAHRFGRIVYQKKIHDSWFDAGAFVRFAAQSKAFLGAAFVPE